MKFYKMHGIGNDYIYFDCMKKPLENPGEVSKKLSRRRFSVGSDGVICLCPSEVADIKMKMYNADGSEGKMCGNGIRCLGKLAHDLGYIKGTTCTVETLSGIKKLELYVSYDGTVSAAKVDMGAAILNPELIPAKFSGESVINQPLEVGGKTHFVTLVSMGNPHCVVFENPDAIDIERLGNLFEHHEVFPDRVNTEFVRVLGRNKLKMRVWERGSGETFACGTGACAAAVAAVLNGHADKGSEIEVSLRGGDLSVTYTDETVYLTGGATLAFVGDVKIK